jgi:hypothetical protein
VCVSHVCVSHDICVCIICVLLYDSCVCVMGNAGGRRQLREAAVQLGVPESEVTHQDIVIGQTPLPVR